MYGCFRLKSRKCPAAVTFAMNTLLHGELMASATSGTECWLAPHSFEEDSVIRTYSLFVFCFDSSFQFNCLIKLVRLTSEYIAF